jgi:hypothetical protein
MRAMSEFVAYPANADLPAFDLSELLDKRLAICAAISSFG